MTEIIAEGTFVKKLVRPILRHGQFRGPGRITVSDAGVRISGKHVYSLGARWGFGVLIWFGLLIVTFGTLAPGILLIYPVVEYWWLKKEDLDVTFAQLTECATDASRQLISLDFQAKRWCRPAVLRSPDWETVANALRQRVPSIFR